MTAAFAMSRSGSRRIVLAWARFTLRRDFAFMTVASNATAHTIWLPSVWRVIPPERGPKLPIRACGPAGCVPPQLEMETAFPR
jgi:hypothetical protein